MRRRELLSSTVKRGEGRDVYNNYEYVDLQLTGNAANLMFATWNVGATKEEEYGNYYQWGAGSTKYANTNQYHTSGTSSAYTLPMSADTARQVMKGSWRMPTKAELQALTAQTDYQWTTINGVNGYKFSKTIDGKERYVFFPAAGFYISGSFSQNGSNGYYWTSTPYSSSYSYRLLFGSGSLGVLYNYRYYGMSVRGVFTKLLGRDFIDGYEYIDLGLPSGLKWATYNVGASSETEYGNYYQYGKGSSRYQVTSGDPSYGGTENPLSLTYDTARKVMKGSWRMPTSAECKELTANTTYTFTTINGVKGGKFSKTIDGKERYVFFPAVGYYGNGSLRSNGSVGYVWASTPYSSSDAYNLYFSNGNHYIDVNGRIRGQSVRGVHA